MHKWPECANMIEKFAPAMECIEQPPDMLQAWRQAIESTKTSTSVGGCGFTQPELSDLPDEALLDLIKIVEDIEPGEWPEPLVTAKVVLLNKIDIVGGPESTRPITIFSLIYRTWAKAHSCLIYKAWADTLPGGIVGGLPRRKADDVWFAIQTQVEDSILFDKPLGGFVLDLAKACNGIPRQPTALLMEKMGVDRRLTQKWISALQACQRVLIVNGTATYAGQSTTGAPEGCPISVLAMLSISFLWTKFIWEPEANTYVYANTREWTSPSPEVNRNSYVKTKEFCRIWRQKMSLPKCWAWAKDKNNKDGWKTLQKEENLVGDTFLLKKSETDLGATMRYNKNQGLGKTADRLNASYKNLKKIQGSPLNSDDKAKIVASAILPAALHASENNSIGERHFKKLRTRIAEAIYPCRGRPNPFLVCAMQSQFNVDPAFYALERSMRTFLGIWHKDREQGQHMWKFMLAANGSHRSYGPCATTRRRLEKIGWHLGQEGTLHTNLGISIDVEHCSFIDVRPHLRKAWNIVLHEEVRGKKQYWDCHSKNSGKELRIRSGSQFRL